MGRRCEHVPHSRLLPSESVTYRGSLIPVTAYVVPVKV